MSARRKRRYSTPEEAALAEWDAYPDAAARVVEVTHDLPDMAVVVIDTVPSHPMYNRCHRDADGWVFSADHN